MIDTNESKFVRWGIVLVLLVAAVLRLAALPDLPLGLHYDEAANLILTRQIVGDSYRPLFIRAYTGKEALFFYAAAPWVWMTGGASWGLRLGAAMIGILTVAATFAAVRALLWGSSGRSQVALIAAGWMAVALPHVLLSRYGFRAISQPLLQALTVALLWRGLRNGRTAWQVASGVALGLTAYTYLAARLFPIPLALALAWLVFRTPLSARTKRLGQLVIVLAAAIGAFAPLGLFFAQNPETFLTRIAQVAAPSWPDALHGIWRCLQALVWPGAGDGYIRFNAPGTPVMRPVGAVLAVLGLVEILRVRRASALEGAGRLLVVVGVLVMLLPSALATEEITPSNLRMVGIYPFIAVLPAWGLYGLLRFLSRLFRSNFAQDGLARLMRSRGGSRALPEILYAGAGQILLVVVLVAGAVLTAFQYHGWAASGALFRDADGEMVLAAEALDAASSPGTTVYVASEHYRHPTVAALAAHYGSAKWLTGGATLVLPPTGEAVTIVPDSERPPAPWPASVVSAGQVSRLSGPAGEVGVTVTRRTRAQVDALRSEFSSEGPAADFAHVVWVYDAAPVAPCRVGEGCPVTVIWEPRAPYAALQPVVRLVHPETGEWVRTMAFHYPPEQWTVGELVLDQFVLEPPVTLPPGSGYQIGVGIYDPEDDVALPRLVDEQFSGFEVLFPAVRSGLTIAPAPEVPSPAQVVAACPGVPRSPQRLGYALDVLGAQTLADSTLLPGSRLTLRLCWKALADAPAFDIVNILLSSEEAETVLFAGEPATGYGFDRWRPGEVIETRHPLRIPRDATAEDYTLSLRLDDGVTIALDTITVAPVVRHFTAPGLANDVQATFSAASGDLIRLLSYDLAVEEGAERLLVTLAWQALAEMEEDYVVFVHVRDAESDSLIVQVDEMPQSPSATPTVRYPTSVWVRDEIVTDVHVLSLPLEVSSRPVALYVGLYLPASGGHLTAAGASRLQLPMVPQASLK